jgi:hypothetical protein
MRPGIRRRLDWILALAVVFFLLVAVTDDRSPVSSSPIQIGVFIALGIAAAIAYMRLRRGVRRTERAVL